MTNVASTPQDIYEQPPDDADINLDEIEERLDTLVNEYRVPMEEIRRSVASNYLDETDTDAEDLQSGNQKVDLVEIDEPEQ